MGGVRPEAGDSIMRKVCLLLTLCAVGLGSYQLGRRPNSPDIVGWMSRRVGQVDWSATREVACQTLDAGRQEVSGWFSADDKPADQDQAGQVRGKAMSARRIEQQSQDQGRAPPCW